MNPRDTVHSADVTTKASEALRLCHMNFTKGLPMTTNGTIKRMTEKGFGFIATAEGTEYFFHRSGCTGTPFDQLREGQAVSFTVGQGPKGPRAENVNVR